MQEQDDCDGGVTTRKPCSNSHPLHMRNAAPLETGDTLFGRPETQAWLLPNRNAFLVSLGFDAVVYYLEQLDLAPNFSDQDSGGRTGIHEPLLTFPESKQFGF
jgi:hypothetical protein